MENWWGPRGSRRSNSDKRVRSCVRRSGSHRILLTALGAALVASLFFASPAHAQTQVDLDIHVGFDNRYAPGQWTPVSVVVDSSQAIEGTLEVTHDQPDGSDSLYTLDIEVAGGGRKEFHLVVPGPPEQRSVTARVVSGDTVLGTTTAQPLELAENALFGLLGDGGIDGFAAEPSLVEMIPVRVTQAQLDLGASALSALSYVVASSDELDGLVPAHRDALDDWIATGGRLLVAAEDPGAVVWPEAAGSMRWSGGRVQGADLTFAEDRVGLQRVGFGEVIVTQGRPSSLPREVIEAALRASPSVYSRGSQEFFNDFGPGTSADVELMNGLRRGGGSMRLSWFVGFLIVYLLLVGPVNYYVLRRRGHKELLWMTVPALALLFSGVAYGLARGSRGGTEAATAGVVIATEYGQEGRAVAVVSSGSGGERTYAFPTKAAVAPSFLPFFGSSQNGSTRLTAEGAQVIVETAPFAMHFARGTLDTFEGFIDAEVRADGRDMRYEVTNRTPHGLDDVTFVFGTQAIEVGELEPGASEEGEFQLVPQGRRWRPRVLVGGLRNALLTEARSLLGPSYFAAPLALATIEDYEMGIRLDGRPQGPAGRFMVASPVEVSAAQRGGAVAGEAGRVDVVSTDGHMVQYRPGVLTLEGFQEAVFAFQPPRGIDAERITGGMVTFNSGGARQDVERYDWASEQWVPLGRAGRGRLVEELPANAFSSSGEAYFRLRANRHAYTEILMFEVEPVIG